MATFSEMQTDVRERIGEDAADFFTDAEVKRALNLALTTFTNEEPWPWLYTEYTATLGEGVTELELPSNAALHRTFNLSLSGDTLVRGRQLERLEPQAGFRARFAYESYVSAPSYYYLTAATRDASEVLYVVRFVPIPDADYELEGQYLRVPEEMVASDDVADLPDEFHPALPAYAAGTLYLKEMDISNKANEQFQLYYGVLAQARKMLEVQVDETVAWSREAPVRGKRRMGVSDRIPLTLGP